MKQWTSVALGVMTAIGGFLEAGTIVTAGEAGSRFGLGLVWVSILSTLAVILLTEMVGRLSAVSGKGYAAAIRERFGFPFYLLPLGSELIAESVLLGAELSGVAIALSLFTGVNWHSLLPVAALLIWVIAWKAPFKVIEDGPALLGLVMLSFLAGIVALGGPPRDLLPTLWRPAVEQNKLAEYLYLAAAIMGANVSPYLIYFYSSGAREERWTSQSLGVNRATAILGMGFGGLGQVALIVLAASVLGPLGLTGNTIPEIGLPMASAFGVVGTALFATTLFATCLGAALELSLALPYNVAQGFGWKWGKERKPGEAPRFFLLVALFPLVGFAASLVGGDPSQLALLAATLMALFLPFSVVPFLVIMNDPAYLGDKTNHRFANLATFGVVLLAFVVAVVSIPLVVLSGGG